MSLCSVSEEVSSVSAREFSGAEGAERGRGHLGVALALRLSYAVCPGIVTAQGDRLHDEKSEVQALNALCLSIDVHVTNELQQPCVITCTAKQTGAGSPAQAVVRDYALSEARLKAGRDAGRLSKLGGVCPAALC